jgi:predicted RNase H-like HicB family nuclease
MTTRSVIMAMGFMGPEQQGHFFKSTPMLRRISMAQSSLEPVASSVALCPELDIASQGDSVEEARKNLAEAVELFFETADPTEIQQRLHPEVFVTQLQVTVG